MGAHAPFSPSSASRWLKCPGSAVLAARMPPGRSGQAAEWGTHCHKVMEEALADRGGTILTDEEEPMVLPVLELVDQLVANDAAVEVRVETKVDIYRPHCWGTSDVLLWQPTWRHLHVIDLKTGVWPVRPDSPQLVLYADGGLRVFPAAERVTCWIVQPQTGKKPKSVEFEPFEVKGLATFARNRIDHGIENPHDLHPGGHCFFCPVKPVCPALRQKALDDLPD